MNDKLRKCYRTNIRIFYFISDSVKCDLLGYSNFSKFIEAEEKLTVALRSVLIMW
jgi:hypothetical protein